MQSDRRRAVGFEGLQRANAAEEDETRAGAGGGQRAQQRQHVGLAGENTHMHTQTQRKWNHFKGEVR